MRIRVINYQSNKIILVYGNSLENIIITYICNNYLYVTYRLSSLDLFKSTLNVDPDHPPNKQRGESSVRNKLFQIMRQKCFTEK